VETKGAAAASVTIRFDKSGEPGVKLYSYFRSSASFRVRIALNLKGVPFEYVPVHLVKNEQFAADYRELSPDGLVPVLSDGDVSLPQSLAICEYLEETRPEPAILPADPIGRAQVRALALIVACEIHPLNNLRVLRYLMRQLGIDEVAKDDWYRHWVENGLLAFERQMIAFDGGHRFCYGDTPTLADICLIPQVFNGQRVNSDFSQMPRITEIFERCMALEAFKRAAPSVQPDSA